MSPAGERPPTEPPAPAGASSVEAELAHLPPGARVDRYVVLREVGHGAMGVVYAAHDPDLDRQVALKLIRTDAAEAAARDRQRERLLREARAMARVSHPNVLPVFDVGTRGDEVFVAMELVAGTTLEGWLREGPRRWQEIVATFVAAGQGLAAAHAAGIVHRDFKPSNVLLGAGQVRVTDFGLARPSPGVAGDARPAPEAALSSRPAGRSPSEASQGEAPRRLAPSADPPPTPTGGEEAEDEPGTQEPTRPDPRRTAAAGTPRYMAPEQWRGRGIDARSDQFGFCVALYEALYRQAPFPGEAPVEIYANLVSGRLRPPPPEPKVPARIWRVLRRGLDPDPNRRYPDLATLLEQLSREPRRVRRRWLALAAVLAAGSGALVAALATGRGAAEPCRGMERHLRGVWNSATKKALGAAFLATGKPWAAQRFARVRASVDRFTGAWVTMRRQACEATHRRKEQSVALLDRRMACLDERLLELRTLLRSFSQLTATTLDRAVKATSRLQGLAPCANAALLMRPPPPPRALAGAIRRHRLALARARGLRRAGRIRDARVAAAAGVRAAEKVHYAPLEGEALLLLGQLEDASPDRSIRGRAEETLFRALAAGERGRHDEVKARAWIHLAWREGLDLRRPEPARRYIRLAAAALQRLGRDPEVEANLRYTEANLARARGELRAALRLNREALTLMQRVGGAGKRAGPLLNQAIILRALGRYRDALAADREAADLLERELGPEHPDTVTALINLGNDHFFLGDLRRAEQTYEHARRALARRHGPDSPVLATVIHNLGDVLRRRGRHRAALRRFRRALKLWERSLGTDHRRLAHPLLGIGQSLLALGRARQAREPLERALRLQRHRRPPSPILPDIRLALARALWPRSAARARALTLARQARDAYRRRPGAASKLGAAERWLKAHEPGGQ